MGRRILEEGVEGGFGDEEFGGGLEGGEAFIKVDFLFVGSEDGWHAVVDGSDE